MRHCPPGTPDSSPRRSTGSPGIPVHGRLRSRAPRLSDRAGPGRLAAPTEEPRHPADRTGGRSRRPGRGRRVRCCCRRSRCYDALRRRDRRSGPTDTAEVVHSERRGGEAGDRRPRGLVRGRGRRAGGRPPLVRLRRRAAGAHRGHGQRSCGRVRRMGARPRLAAMPPGGAAARPARGRRYGEPTVDPHGTTRGDTCHVDVVDRWGNLVSATPSGGWLQSSPVDPGLGFPLGTRAQMFWLERGLPNSWPPASAPHHAHPVPRPARRRPHPRLRHARRRPAGAVALCFWLRHVDGRPGPAGGDRRPAWHTTHVPVLVLPARSTSRRGRGRVASRRRRGRRARRPRARRQRRRPWTLGRLSARPGPRTGILRAAANAARHAGLRRRPVKQVLR